MREGTAERFSCRKHRVPTRCVPDDLLCVFPKKKRKRRALRSRTMNPIGPFVISVVWSRGSRGGPSRTGCRCAAESCRDASRCFGRGGACVFSRRGSQGSPCPAFPCRDGGMPIREFIFLSVGFGLPLFILFCLIPLWHKSAQAIYVLSFGLYGHRFLSRLSPPLSRSTPRPRKSV